MDDLLAAATELVDFVDKYALTIGGCVICGLVQAQGRHRPYCPYPALRAEVLLEVSDD